MVFDVPWIFTGNIGLALFSKSAADIFNYPDGNSSAAACYLNRYGFNEKKGRRNLLERLHLVQCDYDFGVYSFVSFSLR